MMRRTTKVAAALALLAGSALLPAASADANAVEPTGTVFGRVVEAGSGEPITEACVLIWDVNDFNRQVGNIPIADNGKWSATVPVGDWYALSDTCGRTNHIVETFHNVLGLDTTDAEVIHVEEGAKVRGISFSLKLGGTLDVTVVDGHGPVANASVCPLYTDRDEQVSFCGNTDETGVVHLIGLPRRVKLGAAAEGHDFEYFRNADDFDVATETFVPTDATRAITIRLARNDVANQ